MVQHPKRPTRSSGFTLMEIMVVIAILGLLLTLIGPEIYTRLTRAKETTARAQMNQITASLQDYRMVNGRFPDTLEELLNPDEKNFGEAYLSESDLIDPFQTPYEYTKISNSKFELLSYGDDGVEGGAGADADIPHEQSGGPMNF